MSEETIRESFMDAKEIDPAERTRVEVARLAKLDRPGYLAERKATAKALIIPATELDKMVGKERPAPEVAAREPLAPPAPEAWLQPVDGLALLNDLHAFLTRFIIVNRHTFVTLTLWIVFSYLLDVAETSPRLAITSPTKRCGKTLLLDVLTWLVFRPIASSNLSPSAVFRTIDMERCSLLMDEADAMPRKSERSEEIRGLLNSGHTRTSAYAIRNVKVGDDWIPKRFSTWTAIAVAAIGDLPDTWADRSIAIPMMRKPRNVTVERLIRRNTSARAEAVELTRKIARWAADHKEVLVEATPDLPSALDDRASNNWELLLAIADAAGGAWSEMARQAAIGLSGERSDNGSLGEQLLDRLRLLFEQRNTDRLASSEICAHLATLEGEPWVEFGRARKPITPTQLARLLKGFKVVPRTIRIENQTAKGYLLSYFEKVFPAYTSPQAVTPSQTNGENDFSFGRDVTAESDVTGENAHSGYAEKDCDGVTDENPLESARHAFSGVDETEINQPAAAKDGLPIDGEEF